MDSGCIVLLLFSQVLLVVLPECESVGGEFDFLHKAMKVQSKDHDLWCYDEHHCMQSSINSSWERGLCRHGSYQSPINLNPRLRPYRREAKKLNFTYAKRSLYTFPEYRMEHVGHTVMITPPHDHSIQFEWMEKHEGVYRLQEIHFHWGNTNQVGSEHNIDFNSYAMEVHLVHYRVKGPLQHPGYKNIHEAVLSGDRSALAVVAILLHLDYDKKMPSFLDPVASQLYRIIHEGNRVTVSNTSHPFRLAEVLKQERQMFQYDGSLTTPPCSEIVLWLVCRHPVQIREEEVIAFRNLQMMVSKSERNFTEIQEMSNHRRVQRKWGQVEGNGGHLHVRLINLAVT